MSSAVSSPTTSAESGGSVKPARSRSYQPGTETSAKIASTIASAAPTGSTPRLQRATKYASTT